MKKSTNKEIWILVILLAILAVYGFYTVLLSPKINEATELKLQVETEDTTVRGMYNSVLQYETDAETVRESHAQAKTLTDRFYVRSNQETYLNALNQMLTGCSITFETIEASEHDVMDLSADGYRCTSPYMAYIDTETVEADDISTLLQSLEDVEIPDIDEMLIRVEATGSYQGIQQLVQVMSEASPYITCDTWNLEMISESEVVTEENPQVRVKMDFRFVRITDIPCLDVEESVPELPTDFVMPMEFVSGDYKKLFSFSSISGWLRNLLG